MITILLFYVFQSVCIRIDRFTCTNTSSAKTYYTSLCRIFVFLQDFGVGVIQTESTCKRTRNVRSCPRHLGRLGIRNVYEIIRVYTTETPPALRPSAFARRRALRSVHVSAKRPGRSRPREVAAVFGGGDG